MPIFKKLLLLLVLLLDSEVVANEIPAGKEKVDQHTDKYQLGHFAILPRQTRKGLNPKTGQKINLSFIAAKFKPCKKY